MIAAGAIHNPHARLHFGEGRGVQHLLGFPGHRHVDGDEIGGAINRVQIRGEFRADRFRAVLGQIRIIGYDRHAEGDRAFGDFRADAAHAQHAQGFALQFHALKQFAVPLARHHGGVRRGTLRASESSMVKVNSAVVTVLPPGVFITTTPCWVEASMSTLSTPTPARPTTRNFLAASMTFLVTFVSERTTSAVASATSGKSSASGRRFDRTITSNSGRCCKRAMPLGEIGSQIIIFIGQNKMDDKSRSQRESGQTANLLN